MLLEMQLLAMIVPDLNTEADLWSLLEYLLLFYFKSSSVSPIPCDEG